MKVGVVDLLRLKDDRYSSAVILWVGGIKGERIFLIGGEQMTIGVIENASHRAECALAEARQRCRIAQTN